jgi:hypothetical protein
VINRILWFSGSGPRKATYSDQQKKKKKKKEILGFHELEFLAGRPEAS